MRLNRLPHGFTPASLRCPCAMDPESVGKALQDCLQALGTGQGADPPAAPAPQAAAALPAPGPGRLVPAEGRSGGPRHLQPRHHPGARDA